MITTESQKRYIAQLNISHDIRYFGTLRQPLVPDLAGLYSSINDYSAKGIIQEDNKSYSTLLRVPEHPIGLPPQIGLSEAYKLFLNYLESGRQFKYFYKQLMTLRRDILIDISSRNQGLVAKDLGINTVKMSAIVAMLKEMDAIQYTVENENA